MSDGNKRYLGDVWINQENLDRQREFFRDIIESYQDKYGGEFDASTLQGKSATDFATSEQGALAENSLQEPILLGKKRIINVENPQYIWTDALLLEEDESEDPDTQSNIYRLKRIQWYSNLVNSNLTDALVSIYDNVIAIRDELTVDIDNKLDYDVYNDFIEDEYTPLKEKIDENSIDIIINPETGETVSQFNTQFVNGIRPILITEQGYQDLLNSDDPKERAMATYWRNFFIIVDPDDLPGDYNTPWEYALTDPYSFRIDNGYLQVKNNLSRNWVNIAPLSEFLAGANFDDVIKNYVSNSDDFVIDASSLLNSLEGISPTDINEDWQNYPFLSSSLHDDFVNDITINNSNDYTSSKITNAFKTIDIDFEELLGDNSSFQDVEANLSNHSNQLTNIQNALSNVQTDINGIKQVDNTQARDISTIQSQLNTLQNSINSINNSIQSINNNISNIKTNLQNQIDNISTWTSVNWGSNSDAYLYVNQKVHLVLFRAYCIIEKDTSSWTNIPDIAAIPAAYRPSFRTYISSSYGYNNNINVSIDGSTGKLQYRSSAGAKKDNVKDFYVSSVYAYR